jgi:medium-chain acyl-[acyl-carrier-protein] hydrolase
MNLDPAPLAGPTQEAWKGQRVVESFEVDREGRLRPHLLFAWLLASAWGHARASAWSFEALSARNAMWVLNKLQLRITRLPRWEESVTIETWGKGIERFYALRDFAVTSAEGQKLAAATTAWMVLDARTYRPQKLDDMKAGFPWHPERSEVDINLKKVGELEGGEVRARFRVSYSDIDVNRHAAATKYLQWMLDSFSLEKLTAKELSSAEISFLSEATLGDEVSVAMRSDAREDRCAVRREPDQQELCRAVLAWRTAP